MLSIIAFLLRTPVAMPQDTSSTEPQPAEIAIGDSTTLEIVGFGDLLTTFQKENDGSTFDIGQAEVDLESEMTDRISVALAIAYDEGAFVIGAFIVDYTAWSLCDEATSSPLGINSVTVGGGQYDVPFGIDWHVYPSIDRKLVSSPLVVENTHDSWNDYGGYASVEGTWGNATTFIANGFCHEGVNATGEELATHNDLAIGGRLGIAPHETVEVGGSVASISGQDGSHDMLLAGADMQFSVASFKIKGEYIAHRFESKENSDFTNDGYYVQGLYGIGDWYLVGRYGEFRPDQQSADIARMSAGIGHTFNDIVELRLEYQANKATDDAAVFQVAVGF